jgi:hypothetical protein
MTRHNDLLHTPPDAARLRACGLDPSEWCTPDEAQQRTAAASDDDEYAAPDAYSLTTLRAAADAVHTTDYTAPDYDPPNGYTAPLAEIRAAEETSSGQRSATSTFADRYRREGLRDLQETRDALDADPPQPFGRLTDAELGDDPPDPYAAGIRALQEQERRQR